MPGDTKLPESETNDNPCPFLRALAAGGFIAPEGEAVGRIAALVADAAGAVQAQKRKLRVATWAVAAIASGLRPSAIARTIREGLRLAALRNGPLDKRGAGSRIISCEGELRMEELERLDQFASDFVTAGRTERGLDLPALRSMMDANFARAAGFRRAIDRRLMEGEWPILLLVMGKGPEGEGRYLSVSELRSLYVERKLPVRITTRIEPYRSV